MKSRLELLDKMNKTIQIASDRIRYYKQQDKMLQSEIKYSDRNGPHLLLQATGQNASKRDQAADAE